MKQSDDTFVQELAVNWGDLTALRSLGQVLNARSVTGRLDGPTAGLVARVSRLQDALGMELVDCTTPAVRLTEAGTLLSSWVERTTRSWHEARLEATAVAGRHGAGPELPHRLDAPLGTLAVERHPKGSPPAGRQVPWAC